MLYLKNVSYHPPASPQPILKDLNLQLDAQHLGLIVGVSGAGKTTLLDCICGKTKPSSGKIAFGNNIELVGKNAEDITKLGVGRKFQAPSIYGNLTVWENLDLSLKRDSKGVFATLLSRSTAMERERIATTLETIGLQEHPYRRAGSLSHGQKQWLEIGMVILQDPALLLVDEPVAGMTDKETEDRKSTRLNSSHRT